MTFSSDSTKLILSLTSLSILNIIEMVFVLNHLQDVGVAVRHSFVVCHKIYKMLV